MRIFCLLILVAIVRPAQSQIVRSYGGVEHDVAESIILLPDSGFIIQGTTGSIGPNNVNIYTLRLNQFGDTIWTRVIGAGNESGHGAVINSQRLYTISSQVFLGSGGVHVEKWDLSGNIYWGRGFSSAYGTGGSMILSAPGNDMLLVCNSNVVGPPQNEIVLMLMDTNGFVQWIKRYGGLQEEYVGEAVLCENGGYAVVGLTGSFNNAPNGAYDMFLMRLDNNGDTLWTKRYETAPYSIAGSELLALDDNGFLIAGLTNMVGAGQEDVMVVRTDSLGDTLWTRVFGGPGPDINPTVTQTTDGGFLIVAQSASFPMVNDWQYYFIRLDANGDTLWTNLMGSSYHDIPEEIINTPGGGYALLGSSTIWQMGPNTSTYDINLILLDSTVSGPCFVGPTPTQVTCAQFTIHNCAPTVTSGGNSYSHTTPQHSGPTNVLTWCNPLDVGTYEAELGLRMYPNPASIEIIFRSEVQDELCITDVSGKIVWQSNIVVGENRIDVSNLPDGMYFLQTIDYRTKVIVMHN